MPDKKEELYNESTEEEPKIFEFEPDYHTTTITNRETGETTEGSGSTPEKAKDDAWDNVYENDKNKPEEDPGISVGQTDT